MQIEEVKNKIETAVKKSRKIDLGEFFKKNLYKLIIFIVSVIYITQGLFQFVQKEATIVEIIGSVGLSIAVGVIITLSLNNMGLQAGRNSELFLNSLKRYGEAKSKAEPYFDMLQTWCDFKNCQEREVRRKEIILDACLNYKAYNLGYYDLHPEKLNEEQLKAINQAKTLKLPKLRPQELFSDIPKAKIKSHRHKFGETEQEYKSVQFWQNLFSRLGIAVIFGLYSFKPLLANEKTFGNVLWNALQICMWLTFGIIAYYNSKSFMEDEYRQTHIILKTEYLNEFVVTMQKTPDLIKEFGEKMEIDKDIEEFIKEREKEMGLNGNGNRSEENND